MKVYFLPILSPNLPKINAPSGLMIKPAEKVASVARNAAVGFSLGKNWVEIMLARLPKIKKSYHSINVPADEAVINGARLLLRNLLFFNLNAGID